MFISHRGRLCRWNKTGFSFFGLPFAFYLCCLYPSLFELFGWRTSESVVVHPGPFEIIITSVGWVVLKGWRALGHDSDKRVAYVSS